MRQLFFHRARRITRLALLGFGAALVAGTAAAAVPPAARPDTAIVAVEPVIVTAVAPISALTFTTDPRVPRQPVPASDGGDFLKTVPGFAVIRTGGTNGDPVLRGMIGSRVNVLTDGSCMLGACPGRMDSPTSYIVPETFDRLTVLKGPQTVIWGPGASAGTVRFDRQAPAFVAAGARVTSALTGGSWGRNDQMADFAAGVARGDLRVSASRSQQDDYEDGDGERVPSRWNKWTVDGALGWNAPTRTRLELDAGTSDGEARYAGRRMDATQIERRTIGLRARQEFTGVLESIEGQLGWYDVDHVMDNFSLRPTNPSLAMPMTSNVGRRTWAGRLATTWRPGGDLNLVAGADHAWNLHRIRQVAGPNYLGVPWKDDAEFSDVGGFAELNWIALPSTRVVSGGRWDFALAQDRRALTAGMTPMPNPTRGRTREKQLPSGFVRIEREAGEHASLYAGVGHNERFPDYWELISPAKGPAGSVNAFAAIQPERLTQLDLGTQFALPHARAWVSAYAGRVVNDILFQYTTVMGTTTTAARNVDARIAGAEAGATWRLRRAWTLESSIAYSWGRNQTENKPLAQLPPLESRTSLAYDDGRAWSIGVLGRLVATQERFALDQGNVVGRDLGRTAGFGLLSLNAARRLPHGFVVAAGVDNLLDRTYAEHLNLAGNSIFGYPASPERIHEPGRTMWLKLNVKS